MGDELEPVWTVVIAPAAERQIDSALDWWATNRPAAPALLARELER